MTSSKRRRARAGLLACALAVAGCSSRESPRVSLPVVVDGTETARMVTTDLGYRVTISRLRVALRELQLTVGGEAHASSATFPWSIARALGGLLIGTARAHPGHLAGGEVTGVLGGPLLFDWVADGAALGSATLLEGEYQGANFFFRRVAGDAAADGGDPGDPIVGHTLEVVAEAARDDRTLALAVILDLDEGAAMTGAPFQLPITATTAATLGLRFRPSDPTDPAKTIWNGVDFFALADAGAASLAIVPGQGTHNVLRRAFVVHDFYEVVSR